MNSAGPAARPAADKDPRFSAKLHAGQDAILRGGEIELAVELNVAEKWHIYHPIVLDTGMATQINFELPPGASVGPLRFPEPQLKIDRNIRSLALPGRTIVLTRLRLAPDYAGGTVPIKTKVRALACRELCILAEAEATLTLPVSAVPGAPANEALFSEARYGIPEPLSEAPYLTGRLVPRHTQTPAGGESAAVALLKVQRGHHVQDRDPGNKNLIPTLLFLESVPGIEFGRQVWPAPKLHDMPGFGQVREQSGEFVIQVPFRVTDDQFPPGPVRLRALLTYQACTDAGNCYPPEAAEGWLEFEVTPPGTAAVANEDPAIAKLAPAKFESEPRPAAVAEAVDDVREAASPAAADQAFGALDPAEPHLLYMLVLSFLGGLILNVMPCVFPVISIKIISFVRQAGEDRGRVLRLGLMFCAGIMAWFWVFAVLTGYGQIPWQSPVVVIAVSAIVFVFALNLFGVFEIMLPGSAAGALDELAAREGYTGAFLKGFLATLLGTACTAPLLAPAMAYAATHAPIVSAVIFTGAGLGMSSPYLVLAAFPGWLRFLPHPGPWMTVFKEIMGFVLLGTVVWLMMTIGDQLGARGLVWTTCFFGFLALAAWLFGKIRLNWSTQARFATRLSALAIIVVGWWFSFERMYDLSSAGLTAGVQLDESSPEIRAAADAILAEMPTWTWNDHIPWQSWKPGLDRLLARRGYTVYVDFTATWCATCLTNKATSLEIESTRNLMREKRVIPLKGDFTKRDAAIYAELKKFKRPTVPLNVVYPAGLPGKPIELPVVLTPGTVQKALARTEAPPVARANP